MSIFSPGSVTPETSGLLADAQARSTYNVSGKKKILMLISDTGGGHRASAKAIADALEREYPAQFTIDIYDIWTHAGKFPMQDVVTHYRLFTSYPWLWKLGYDFTGYPVTRLVITTIILYQSTYLSIFRYVHPSIHPSIHPSVYLHPN